MNAPSSRICWRSFALGWIALSLLVGGWLIGRAEHAQTRCQHGTDHTPHHEG